MRNEALRARRSQPTRKHLPSRTIVDERRRNHRNRRRD